SPIEYLAQERTPLSCPQFPERVHSGWVRPRAGRFPDRLDTTAATPPANVLRARTTGRVAAYHTGHASGANICSASAHGTHKAESRVTWTIAATRESNASSNPLLKPQAKDAMRARAAQIVGAVRVRGRVSPPSLPPLPNMPIARSAMDVIDSAQPMK